MKRTNLACRMAGRDGSRAENACKNSHCRPSRVQGSLRHCCLCRMKKIGQCYSPSHDIYQDISMRYLHTMVRVSDLDASLDFYCAKLGLVEVRRMDNEKGRFTLVFLVTPEDAARLKLTGPRPDHHHEQAKACRPYQHCFRKLMAFEWTRPRQRRHAGHGFRSRVPAPVFA